MSSSSQAFVGRHAKATQSVFNSIDDATAAVRIAACNLESSLIALDRAVTAGSGVSAAQATVTSNAATYDAAQASLKTAAGSDMPFNYIFNSFQP